MKLLDLYKRAKETFPFTFVTAPLVKFLPRRSSIDVVDYKYESSIKITKSKRIAKEDENEDEVKKKHKKTKKTVN